MNKYFFHNTLRAYINIVKVFHVVLSAVYNNGRERMMLTVVCGVELGLDRGFENLSDSIFGFLGVSVVVSDMKRLPF